MSEKPNQMYAWVIMLQDLDHNEAHYYQVIALNAYHAFELLFYHLFLDGDDSIFSMTDLYSVEWNRAFNKETEGKITIDHLVEPSKLGELLDEFELDFTKSETVWATICRESPGVNKIYPLKGTLGVGTLVIDPEVVLKPTLSFSLWDNPTIKNIVNIFPEKPKELKFNIYIIRLRDEDDDKRDMGTLYTVKALNPQHAMLLFELWYYLVPCGFGDDLELDGDGDAETWHEELYQKYLKTGEICQFEISKVTAQENYINLAESDEEVNMLLLDPEDGSTSIVPLKEIWLGKFSKDDTDEPEESEMHRLTHQTKDDEDEDAEEYDDINEDEDPEEDDDDGLDD